MYKIIILVLIIIYFICYKGGRIEYYEASKEYSEEYSAAIVEPRKHKNLELVVLNMIKKLPDDCLIQIFHGKNAIDFIMGSKLGQYVKSGKVRLHALDVDNLPTPNDYSKLLASEKFWNQIIGKKVLIFQTDSVLCGSSDYDLNDFLEFDYIGSNWIHYKDGIGGNGGLSIRDRDKSIECIKNKELKNDPEDIFYINCYKEGIIKGRVATKEETYKFGTQNEWKGDRSFGTHRPELIQPEKDRKAFLDYCHEAKDLK